MVRVLQLNAGTLLEPGWLDRRHEVVAWLERLAPDVVCLQEIWEAAGNPNTARWLIDQMPHAGWHFAFGGDSFGPSLWPDASMRFGSAVLSRWPIDHVEYHRLPVAEDADQFIATVPWELLHVRTVDLDVFSCHLVAPPQHGHHRELQVLAIDELVRAARGELDASPPPGTKRPAMPAILCGDFNAEPDSDEIRFLTSLTNLDARSTFWQDSWRVAGDGPGWSQDWRTNPTAAALNVPRKRIDYVFVGDPFQRTGSAGRVLHAELAMNEPLTGTMASDHFGLVVDIVWPGRPSHVEPNH